MKKKKENKEKKNFFKVIWLGQVKGEMKVFSPQVYQFFFFFFKIEKNLGRTKLNG